MFKCSKRSAAEWPLLPRYVDKHSLHQGSDINYLSAPGTRDKLPVCTRDQT